MNENIDFTTKPKRNKYGAIKTEYDGHLYHSKKEAKYAQDLDLMRKAVNDMDRVIKVVKQPKYPIEINNKHIFNYFADFKVTYADGRIEVIDVKGKKTDMYRLKKKAVEAYYNIEILEI